MESNVDDLNVSESNISESSAPESNVHESPVNPAPKPFLGWNAIKLLKANQMSSGKDENSDKHGVIDLNSTSPNYKQFYLLNCPEMNFFLQYLALKSGV